MNIGIIGGGIAGLTAASKLVVKGHQVTIFESDPQVGGQAGTLMVGGGRLEKYYHHIFTTDREILALLEELGLLGDLRWIESKVGFYHGGRIYDFVSAGDLLRFTPISLIDRVRLGFAGLYLQRYKKWRNLEGYTARDWIIKYAGKRAYDVVWGPLLRGKFGERAADVGMVWYWGKVHLRFASRGKGMQKEKLGYLNGSFGRLIDVLERKIIESGGRICPNTEVTGVITENGRASGLRVVDRNAGSGREASDLAFDTVVATVPSTTFLELVPELTGEYAQMLRQAKYQAALCLILRLRRSFSRIYWLNISDPEIPFVAAIEQTNFIDPEVYGGSTVLYLSNYLASTHPLYKLNRDELLAAYLPHLKKINPDFSPDWVEESWLFRSDSGQPIITTNYSKRIPEHRTPIAGLYLANTTQIYPEDRGMNYSVRLGLTIDSLLGEDAPSS